MRDNISVDVYILSHRDLSAREEAAFRRGVDRGRFEASMEAGKAEVALNCTNWADGYCETCGAQTQSFQVNSDYKCPRFVARKRS